MSAASGSTALTRIQSGHSHRSAHSRAPIHVARSVSEEVHKKDRRRSELSHLIANNCLRMKPRFAFKVTARANGATSAISMKARQPSSDSEASLTSRVWHHCAPRTCHHWVSLPRRKSVCYATFCSNRRRPDRFTLTSQTAPRIIVRLTDQQLFCNFFHRW